MEETWQNAEKKPHDAYTIGKVHGYAGTKDAMEAHFKKMEGIDSEAGNNGKTTFGTIEEQLAKIKKSFTDIQEHIAKQTNLIQEQQVSMIQKMNKALDGETGENEQLVKFAAELFEMGCAQLKINWQIPDTIGNQFATATKDLNGKIDTLCLTLAKSLEEHLKIIISQKQDFMDYYSGYEYGEALSKTHSGKAKT
jgi:hypothetical protein